MLEGGAVVFTMCVMWWGMDGVVVEEVVICVGGVCDVMWWVCGML